MLRRLALAILIVLICCTVVADADAEIIIDLTNMTANAPGSSVRVEDDCITILKAGTYRISGALPEGRLVVDSKKTARITLILDGAEITCSDYAPLYLKKAGEVSIVLAEGSENRLESGGSFAAKDDNKVDAALFSKCDVTLSGMGGLTILSPGGNGLTGKDDVTIVEGRLTVNASGHALEANDHLVILGGEMKLTAGKDAVHTENDDDVMLGIFDMQGGNVSISAGDDGVHAAAALTISGGMLHVEQCVEGLEAAQVHVSGGDICINASDDAINATRSGEEDEQEEGVLICISGGAMELVTKGDGLDSNGDILMEGGTVVIHGPGRTRFGFGALDYAGEAVITGGRIVAYSVKGKAFSEDSTQPSFNLNLPSEMERGTAITVKDPQGNVLFAGEAAMDFSTVIVSLPEMQVGHTYSVTLDDETFEVRQRTEVVKKTVK